VNFISIIKMDINTLYDTLTGNVMIVKSFNSNHISTKGVADIETELLLGKPYEARIPDNYPNDFPETAGLRTLHRPVESSYREHSLRVGTLELHIRDKKSEENEKSLLLIYSGRSHNIEFPGARGGFISNTPTMVNMLENGVISTGILVSLEHAIIQSWYLEGMGGYGGIPYVQTPDEFKKGILTLLEAAGIQWIPELNVLSDFYFLAKNTFEQTEHP